MTNKEMIKDLSRIMDLLDMHIDLNQSLNITQMEVAYLCLKCIVRALEQQPCEDCISRTEALKHGRLIYDDDGKGYVVVRVDEIIDLPSVTPSRPKGKWKRISPAGIYECTNCNQVIMTSDIDCYKFCHGCGVRMEGKE